MAAMVAASSWASGMAIRSMPIPRVNLAGSMPREAENSPDVGKKSLGT